MAHATITGLVVILTIATTAGYQVRPGPPDRKWQ
jgi:hypothetical protein